MANKIYFDIENAEVIDEPNDSQFATARIRAFSSDANKHDLYCSEETLKKTAPSIYNKPVLYFIDKVLDDFYTHVPPERSLIAGFVVPNSADFVRLEDGRLSLNVLAKIWKRYAPKVIQLFQRDSGKKKVSVEMELLETTDMKNGLTEMVNFVYAGITLLGDFISEASPGANMQMLSFSEENEEFKKAYELEFGKYQYEGVDFVIPEQVKINVTNGLNLYKNFGRGGTSVSVADARYLANNKEVEPSRVRRISKYFLKKGVEYPNDQESDEWISWQLHGGYDGKKWSFGLCKELDELDNKSLAYFDNIVTFPYDSLKDANPAIRGIKPPVTLGQANQIAKEAEGIIRSDKKKNGWAIAIGNFKNRHKVVNGKWVAKEKNMASEEDNVENEKELEQFALEVKNTLKDLEIPEEELTSLEEEAKNFSLENLDEWKKLVENKVAEFAEDKEEEKEEKEEEKEESEENMSDDFAFDFSEAFSLFTEDFENYSDASDAFCMEPAKANYAQLAYYMYKNMSAMKAEMAKLKEENETYMAENEELKKFKADKEKEEFNFAVDTALKEIENRVEIPTQELTALKEQSEEFTLETFDVWKNLAQSKAFEFTVRDENVEENKPMRTAWGFPSRDRVSVNGSPWKR